MLRSPSLPRFPWILALLLSVSCSSNQPAGDTGGLAPFPYTASEIRRANPPKTVLVYRMEAPGGTFIQTTSFLPTDKPGRATIQTKRMTEKGSLIAQPETTVETWEELRNHASFPAATTVRSEDRVNTPAGSYDCWLYTVEAVSAGAPVARFWFAFDKPGPPVVYETELDGQILSRMVLLEYRRP